MLVCKMSGFIYWDEGAKLAKSFFKSVDGLDALDLQYDYLIGKAFFGCCWLGFAYWDKWTKMRKTLINQLDNIIYLDYLNNIKRHEIVW